MTRPARLYAIVSLFLITLFASVGFATPSVEDFARLPTFSDLEIAPGGKYLAARVNIDNRYSVVVYDISGPAISIVYGFQEDEEFSVSWFHWKSPHHLLTSVDFTGERGGLRKVQTDETRLLTLDARKAELIALYRTRRGEAPIQIQDDIVSLLPNDPEHILVEYSRDNPEQPMVWKVNVTKTAKHKRYMPGQRHVSSWMTDFNDEVRVGQGVRGDKHPYLTIKPVAEGQWQDFSHRVNKPGLVFAPVAFRSDPNQLYVASNHNGDPTGLYIFDIDKDEFIEQVFQHDTVDILNIHVDQKTAELRSINFAEAGVETHYVSTPLIQDEINDMLEHFPGKSISTRSISSDENYAVFKVQSANDPGTYYLYDRVQPLIRQLPHQYPGLADVELGRTFSTSYDARDGLAIPAFVTLPPGMDALDDATELPFVILPHGGPAARDFLGFDFWVQLVASRGYGILQMNFRGSAGYGQAFQEAGSREWGQAMQDDITDGVFWLMENGYADADRIAIMGGSYGGYAALMGAVKTPELFQCAVSFAGVSDLPDLLRLERRFIGGRYATRFVGDLWKDRKMLAANSPARRAEEVQVPVLLVHGDNDTVVDVDQSEKMARELDKHGKKYRYVVLEDGDHHLSLYQNRLQFLTEMDQFLGTCLQAPVETTADMQDP